MSVMTGQEKSSKYSPPEFHIDDRNTSRMTHLHLLDTDRRGNMNWSSC